MDYKERVLKEISTMEQRAEVRESLWRSIAKSFEEKGPDRVTEQLAAQIGDIEVRFTAVLKKLDGLL